MKKTYKQTRYGQYAEDNVSVTLRESFADCGGGSEVLVLESNQNHATIADTEICPTLSASMGLGGGYVPMIVGTITMNSYQVITESDEPIAPILSSDAHRGGV